MGPLTQLRISHSVTGDGLTPTAGDASTSHCPTAATPTARACHSARVPHSPDWLTRRDSASALSLRSL